MKYEDEFKKCQNIVDISIKAYIGMLEKKELLNQSLKLSSFISTPLEKELYSSIRTIQETFYSSLLIDIHAWLFDASTKSSNLSLHKLIKKFERQDFRNEIENYFKKPPSTISLNENTNQFWHEQYKLQKSKDFQILVDDCLNTYKNFLESKLGNRIKNIRDKLFAHKDGEYSTKDNEHQIGEVFEAMSNMRTIIISFNKLIQKAYYPIEEMEEIASKKAQLFWKHIGRK